MRQKRAKAYRKLMSLYSHSFSFRQPYQVLVDSEFCKTAIALNMDLAKQLSIVLQGLIKPMITQCCIHELYLSGKSHQPAVDLAKTFERRKCNHREAIPGEECLLSVVGPSNKHRYVVASMSQPLRAQLRATPAVPLVHVNRSVIVLEPPSDATLQSKIRAEEEALHPSAPERAVISAAKTTANEPVKKRKRAKGPNPLSVKKKKLPVTQPTTSRTTKSTPAAKQQGSHKVAGVQQGLAPSAQAGEKRKREEDQVESYGRRVDVDGVGTHPAQRRKRRRKTEERHTDA